jgi:hypothetical protein
MNGRSLEGGAELAGWAEEGVRRLLRQAALGELGGDLSATADESLIATGLEGGDAEITVSVDATPEPEPELVAGPADDFRVTVGSNEREEDMQETRIMEPVPAADEIRITATPWLDEVSEGNPGDSLEWPAAETERDLQHRERIDTPRVRHLFPVPDADWEVSHLEYEHYGRDAS